jgi:hypothetical protein
MKTIVRTNIIATALFLTAPTVFAEGEERNLAQELTNPIASLYTLPIQFNYDRGLGPGGDGTLRQINLQPLIPITLNDDWSLISRTIIPLVDQEGVTGIGKSESGMGDILESLFFSPNKPTRCGWIWGAGPAISIPTATNDALGIDSWAFGPTAVALKTTGQWTVGALVNHLWATGGDSNYNATYLEPWVSYVLPTNTTVSMSVESNYDWNTSEMSLPINFIVDQLVTIGDQPVSIGVTAKYWADSPKGGPEGWGGRLQLTFVWPK